MFSHLRVCCSLCECVNARPGCPAGGYSASIVAVKFLIQRDLRSVNLTLDRTGLRVAPEQKIVFSGQLTGFDSLRVCMITVQHGDLGASGDVQPGLYNAAISQGDANTGIGADQAVLANGDQFGTAAGQRAHGGTAAAQVT